MLEIVPCTIQDAKAFVNEHHRHHRCGAKQTGLFAVAVAAGCEVVGVAIVGRPVARGAQDGFCAEVTRLCVLDGHKNACSMLYAACWRAARAIGYRKLITYILDTEPGTSLRAAGWRCVGEVRGRSWSCEARPRIDKHPTQGKLRWEMMA
jgi:hypothetical protein